MRIPTTSVGVAAVLVAAGCAIASTAREARPGIHPCETHPLVRSAGLFGGPQPEVFLAGPDLRESLPPPIDRRTRVIDVTSRGELTAPVAEPWIDKCASSLRWSPDTGVLGLTVLWDDRNCDDPFDEDDIADCRSRARFEFALEETGLGRPRVEGRQGLLDWFAEQDLAIDAYFTRQSRPSFPRRESGVQVPGRADVHLVARIVVRP